MKKEELISVIVPVYNVEKYLENCLNSILNQTYKNLEIILVDDGSTDNSGDICDKYSKEHSNIRVYYKENGGLSSARNKGINAATGKYITFVDSDDTIENDYIYFLYRLLINNNADISVCDFNIIKGKKKKRKMNEKLFVYTNTEALKKMLLNEFSVSATAKLYKAKLFDDVKFPEGKFYEDNGTTYKLIIKSKTVCVSNLKKYNYFIRKNSITNQKMNLQKLDYIELVDEECDDILKFDPSLNQFCILARANSRLSIIRQIVCSSNRKEFKDYEQLLKTYFKMNKDMIVKNKYCSKKTKFSIYLLSINMLVFKIGAIIYEKIK